MKFFYLTAIFSFLIACESEIQEFEPVGMKFTTLGEWDSLGVPQYLCERASRVDTTAMRNFHSTFISKENIVPKYPEWLENTVNRLVLREGTDMHITFLFEEAHNTNILGYYIFPTDEPPATSDDIKDYFVLFPNVTSEDNKVLLQGDKICLEDLPAGYSIGFFLVVQGWKNGELSDGHYTIFSRNAFNNVQEGDQAQKSLLLFEENSGIFILTFEALLGLHSDHDYDDATVIIELSNPKAVDTTPLIKLPEHSF